MPVDERWAFPPAHCPSCTPQGRKLRFPASPGQVRPEAGARAVILSGIVPRLRTILIAFAIALAAGLGTAWLVFWYLVER